MDRRFSKNRDQQLLCLRFPPTSLDSATILLHANVPTNSKGSTGLRMISSVSEPLATPQAVGRRIERLRNDNGFRLLQRAKAHLWTDWLNHGSANESAIE